MAAAVNRLVACLSPLDFQLLQTNERVWNSSTSLLTWHACRTATISIWGTHTHTFHTWVGNVDSAVFAQSYGTCSSAFRGFVCRVSTPEPSIMSYLTQLKLLSKCVARLLRSSVCVHCTDSTECFEPFAESDFYHLFFLNQCQKAFDIIHLRRDEWARTVYYYWRRQKLLSAPLTLSKPSTFSLFANLMRFVTSISKVVKFVPFIF